MDSIEVIIDRIKKKSTKDDRYVRGLWSVDSLFYPSDNGRIFDNKFLISQTLGQGCAYSVNREYDGEYLRNIIGKDFCDVDINDTALMISLLDSIYGELYPMKPTKSFTFTGDSETKMHWRSSIIFDESINLMKDTQCKKVVNVGVVGNIIKQFSEREFQIVGTDFDTSIVGTKLFGNNIYSGNNTLDIVADSDLAIVTGMTISTNTIDEIIKCCNHNNTKLIIFAETGANLAQFYIEMGVDSYISELFPFYIFNGTSTINVYNRQI